MSATQNRVISEARKKNKTKKWMRRFRRLRMLYGFSAALAVLLIVFLGLLQFGGSSQSVEENLYAEKYYTSVMITYEVSAEDYAKVYADPLYYDTTEDYLREVCRINHLTMTRGEIDGLQPGNYIIIPYYSEKTS